MIPLPSEFEVDLGLLISLEKKYLDPLRVKAFT